MLNKQIQKVTWKHWLTFFLLSQIIYVVMLTKTIPTITQQASGMKPFDMLATGYSQNYANLFLSTLTNEGYHLYKYVQLPLDIVFPMFNFLAGFCMTILLLRFYNRFKPKKHNFMQQIVLFLPFLAMLCDYVENIFIFIMLSLKENVPSIIVSSTNFFTVTKSMSTMIFYVISLLIVIAIGVRWIQNKRMGN